MRWPRFVRRTGDAGMAATASAVTEFLARQETLGVEPRERIRRSVVAAVQARPAERPGRAPAHPRRRTAALALGLVAVLALAGTVAAAESGPGQPFYGLRLTVESLTLPSGGSARTQALLAQLEQRLTEARDQSANGNANGVSDAVRAYLATLDQINSGTGQGVSQTAVEAALQQHLDVLGSLLGSAPSAAQPGLQRALTHTQQALQQRLAPGPSSGPSGHPGPPSNAPGRP